MEVSRSHRKANVLVVDDNPANLLSLEAVLGNDHNVISARSGPEAISIIGARRDVDVVLLDVQMPGMDGFETATRIKELPNAQDLPIIFVTAVYTEDPYVRRGYEVGGVDYFAKPFNPDLLRLKVQLYASFRLKAELLREHERRRSQTAELLETGRSLFATAEQLPTGALIANASGSLSEMTEEVGRLLMATATEPGPIYEQVTRWWSAEGNVFTRPDGLFRRALRQGGSAAAERVEVLCLDGSTKDVFASVAPLRGIGAAVAELLVLLRDVQAVRQMEAVLEERVVELISAD